MKYITIFFDLEGWYEAPYRRKFNLEENMRIILDILNTFEIKAVFNTCGIVAENFPMLIKKLYADGHEISSHGYAHENFSQLEPEELNSVLEKTEMIIKEITGEKPKGVRPPWLLSNKSFYYIAEKRGYDWVSNVSIPFVETLYRPSQFKKMKPEWILQFTLSKLRELLYKKSVYSINNLVEIPCLSTLDGELLGLMDTLQKSPEVWLSFAYESLIAQFNKSNVFFNLNFHPWLIGSANRPSLLEKILNYISKQPRVEIILARQLAEKITKNHDV